jgi:hypothetical protein
LRYGVFSWSQRSFLKRCTLLDARKMKFRDLVVCFNESYFMLRY